MRIHDLCHDTIPQRPWHFVHSRLEVGLVLSKLSIHCCGELKIVNRCFEYCQWVSVPSSLHCCSVLPHCFRRHLSTRGTGLSTSVSCADKMSVSLASPRRQRATTSQVPFNPRIRGEGIEVKHSDLYFAHFVKYLYFSWNIALQPAFSSPCSWSKYHSSTQINGPTDGSMDRQTD